MDFEQTRVSSSAARKEKRKRSGRAGEEGREKMMKAGLGRRSGAAAALFFRLFSVSPPNLSLSSSCFPFSSDVLISFRLLCGHDEPLEHFTCSQSRNASAARVERRTELERRRRGRRRRRTDIRLGTQAPTQSLRRFETLPAPSQTKKPTSPVGLAADISLALVAVGRGSRRGGRLLSGGTEQKGRRRRR